MWQSLLPGQRADNLLGCVISCLSERLSDSQPGGGIAFLSMVWSCNCSGMTLIMMMFLCLWELNPSQEKIWSIWKKLHQLLQGYWFFWFTKLTPFHSVFSSTLMFKNVAWLQILELLKSLNHFIVGQMKADSLRNFKQSYLKVKLIFLKLHVIYLFEISEKKCALWHI